MQQVTNVLEQVMIWSVFDNAEQWLHVIIDLELWDCTVESILNSFSTVW